MENTHLDPVIPSDANNLPKQEEELKSAEAEVTTEVTPMSREEIITRISELVNGPIEEIKDEVDTLKQNYYKTKRIETEEAYKTYIESGQPESGFVVPYDPYEERLKELLATYKERKALYLQQLDKQREENLARKNALLDELKAIIDNPDEVGKQYQRVQQIQQEFKDITDVPAPAVAELWKNTNFTPSNSMIY